MYDNCTKYRVSGYIRTWNLLSTEYSVRYQYSTRLHFSLYQSGIFPDSRTSIQMIMMQLSAAAVHRHADAVLLVSYQRATCNYAYGTSTRSTSYYIVTNTIRRPNNYDIRRYSFSL